MVAFSNCTSTTGFKFKVENGADELAETELEFTALKDSNDDFYYEALVDEVDDAQVKRVAYTIHTRSCETVKISIKMKGTSNL